MKRKIFLEIETGANVSEGRHLTATSSEHEDIGRLVHLKEEMEEAQVETNR